VARYLLPSRTWVDGPSHWGSLGQEPAAYLRGGRGGRAAGQAAVS